MSENDNFDDAGHLGDVYLYSYPGKINNNYSTPNISRAHEWSPCFWKYFWITVMNHKKLIFQNSSANISVVKIKKFMLLMLLSILWASSKERNVKEQNERRTN